MNEQAIEKTELNKIQALVSAFAVLEGGKRCVLQTPPSAELAEVNKRLKITEECIQLLFTNGVAKIEYFSPFSDELARAKKGSTLSCGELLKAENLLRSARIAQTSVQAVVDGEITAVRELSDRLYFDKNLEEDIREKILNEDEVSDYASDRLYTIRREIRSLNERIRVRLQEYLSGNEGKYLQDGIVTMRDNRYVLPVRAEYKRNIKGFIHDRSSSGATFFIEPEEILEMNNELRSLAADEREEVERILGELSRRVGFLADELELDILLLEELDAAYARAEYAYKLSCVKPKMNEQGVVRIDEGRHPLIDRKKVVPVSMRLGESYRFLLVSGPNTGGKTVSLKMVGLFCLMAMCGLFIPAKRAELSTFEEVYCDVGDAQSIEENLSTFSSHITNIIGIVEKANARSLILIDELGGGTDPDEGQALAKAIVADLLQSGASGVVTTHYTALKEFAFATDGIENACMEFDSNTLQPLYAMHVGLPGSSNALAISRRLGLKASILEAATANLSEDAQKFENIVRSAEESRILAEETLKETNRLKAEWQEKLAEVERERERLKKEKEKLYASAKAESRRIINDKTADAEELLHEIENIFAKERLTEGDLIQARTLKNRLQDKAYEQEEESTALTRRSLAVSEVRVGATVFVTSIGQEGVVQSVRLQKGEAEVQCGSLRVRSKITELCAPVSQANANANKPRKWQKNGKDDRVQVNKRLTPKPAPSLELNIIGLTVHEALPEVQAFLDSALLSNLEEVRIVHGMGTGKLRAGVHEYLRTCQNVAEYRLGKYGEGDTGVTIVKLK